LLNPDGKALRERALLLAHFPHKKIEVQRIFIIFSMSYSNKGQRCVSGALTESSRPGYYSMPAPAISPGTG
jgi:hypothetical protein